MWIWIRLRIGSALERAKAGKARLTKAGMQIFPGERLIFLAVSLPVLLGFCALLAALAHLRRYHPSRFELEAITIDMGFPGMDFAPVSAWCAEHGVPYTIVKTDIREIVFDARGEDNPCSLCSKMRRGALNDAIKARGCNKLALGQLHRRGGDPEEE